MADQSMNIPQFIGFPGGSAGKESAYSVVGKIPWRREWLPTPVFWPGEFHGLYIHGVAKSRARLSDFHFHIYINGLLGSLQYLVITSRTAMMILAPAL